ncbi:hypothetical protein TOPH_02972 [Tolypocladium ophioglossoides CBS 100239]|uniref:Aminoglycoside phosphotransferase domain-containing protein n=1 Tax=Tolypocladium ophioglossoides (strain CBS 100239) TaxID=1163406 RepID=A0A0L0NDL4_TOLOC|nr:hypothetical protein TOPH_02972 [Tolypocladium ophioglossoides CBS 100239]
MPQPHRRIASECRTPTMPQVNYDLDRSIAAFFSSSGISATREQCDEFARREFGGAVHPVSLQGMASYTVTAGSNKIVQFREQNNSLDEGTLALARAAHPEVVASCAFHGLIGELRSDPEAKSALAIYSMNNLPGNNFIYLRSSLAASLPLHLATLESLARFFAQSWLSGRPADPAQVLTTVNECAATFRYLSDTLPSRFKPYVTQIQGILPMLRSGEHPVVLTHGDLNEMNILVDHASGKITGVVDWAEASFHPFGFALYALDNALGSMGPNGWEYFDNADDLRDEFWSTFSRLVGGLSESRMESIRLARVAGLLIRYGTPYDRGFGGMVGVRDPSDASLRYLDALLSD